MTYLLLKLLHIAAVIAFLGNIVTGLFWHGQALRRGDPGLLAHTVAAIIRSDRWFTIPGTVVIVVSGVALAYLAGLPILGTGWIAWTLGLFVVSGVLFVLKVAPLQRQLLRLAAAADFDQAAYRALTRRWEAWGAAALVTPLAGLVLMVLKPAL